MIRDTDTNCRENLSSFSSVSFSFLLPLNLVVMICDFMLVEEGTGINDFAANGQILGVSGRKRGQARPP